MTVAFLHNALTGVLAWWAISLAWQSDLFEKSLSFRVFVEIMPRECWAVLFTCIVAFGICGAMPFGRRICVFSSVVLGTTHAMIGLLILVSARGSTGIGAYLGLAAIGYLLVHLRTKVHLV